MRELKGKQTSLLLKIIAAVYAITMTVLDAVFAGFNPDIKMVLLTAIVIGNVEGLPIDLSKLFSNIKRGKHE